MRVETYTRNVYTLDEVKEKAIETNWDINVDYDWWEYVYNDAETIGIKITEFDLDRYNYCKGDYIKSASTVAELILKNHGSQHNTYKIAESFLKDSQPLIEFIERVDGSNFDLFRKDSVYNKYNRVTEELEDLQSEFKNDLLSEYATLLQNEYEYLTSEEAVYETLQANGYEFNEKGEIL